MLVVTDGDEIEAGVVALELELDGVVLKLALGERVEPEDDEAIEDTLLDAELLADELDALLDGDLLAEELITLDVDAAFEPLELTSLVEQLEEA